MSKLQGYGWLLVGAVLALAVPILAIDQLAIGILSAILPLPWGRLGIAVLIFWTAAALYFRSHWAATLDLLQAKHRQLSAANERLRDIAADAERSAYLLADNLEEVKAGDGGTHAMYLDGARAHAAKLADVGKRCRAVGAQLVATPSTDADDLR